MIRLLFVLVAALLVSGCKNEGNEPLDANVVVEPVIEPAQAPSPSQPPTSHNGAAPLPQGRTMRDVEVSLRQRADKGDAQASCQLAREMDFCAGAEEHARTLAKVAETIRATKGGPLTQANNNYVLATMAELAQVRRDYCVGATDVTPHERLKYWRQAALRGHVASMIQYGSGEAFGRDQTLATLDELKVYSVEGVRIMKAAARSGSLQANLMLARAYAPVLSAPPTTPLLREAAKRDASVSLAYYMVADQLLRSSKVADVTAQQLRTEAESFRNFMTTAELAAADQMFAALQEDLKRSEEATFDPVVQNGKDANQPVPGTGFCSSDAYADGAKGP